MEAFLSSLGNSPGIRFDPDDATLVIHYLLPRLSGHDVPVPGLIIDDDPYSAEPWTLLKKHGMRDTAYFFAKKKLQHGKSTRCSRTAGGGTWRGQRRDTHGAVTDDGVPVQWHQYMLSFTMAGEKRSQGWVIGEYELLSPTVASADAVVLCRISLTAQSRTKRKRNQCTDEDVGSLMKASRHCMNASAATPIASVAPGDCEEFTLEE